MRRSWISVAVMCAALAACQPQPISQADDAAIRAVIDQQVAAVNSGNADAFTATYASDAIVQPPGMPGATGTAAVHKMISDMFGPMKLNIHFTVTKIAGQGDVAYLTGTFHLSGTMKDSTLPAPPPANGKETMVFWRQSDKSWKIVADAWNEDPAPSAPEPARPRRH